MTWIAKPAEPQPGATPAATLSAPRRFRRGSVKIAVPDPKWLRSRRTKRSACWRKCLERSD